VEDVGEGAGSGEVGGGCARGGATTVGGRISRYRLQVGRDVQDANHGLLAGFGGWRHGGVAVELGVKLGMRTRC
jgi:hypothetical protein